MTSRALVPCGLLCALGLARGAGAEPPRSALLPSATAAIRMSPPLQTSGATTAERRVPGRVTAATRVAIGIGRDGSPVRVVALNRLVVTGTGDYSFVVPAPADDARPAPESASVPGLREGAVLWQGFVSKRRLLAAVVTLHPAAVAASLPLRVSVADRHATIENATATRLTMVAANARPRAVAAAVDAARSALRAGRGVPTAALPARGSVRSVSVTIVAPIVVSGRYRFGGGRTRAVSAVVSRTPLRLDGGGELTLLELTARPLAPAAALRGSAWTFGTAARALSTAALAGQYNAFLANPDPLGRSTTTYRYTLAPAEPTRAGDQGGRGPWLAVAFAALFGGALVAGVVAWAHS